MERCLKGVGIAGYISKFLNNYTIGNSGIFESQGNIGIGTAAPEANLDILGKGQAECRLLHLGDLFRK